MKLKVCQLLLLFIFIQHTITNPINFNHVEQASQVEPSQKPSNSEIETEKESAIQNHIQGQEQGGDHNTHGQGDVEGDTHEGSHEEPENSQEEDHTESHSHHHYLSPSSFDFWRNVLISAILTCIGGFCSGMTVGLMSIDRIELEMMSVSDNQQEKKIGQRIMNVVKNHHLFLVTLLLANAMALQTLPLVVHSLMPDWAAILFSTFIVLIVGEIIPQAYCTGPKKITLANYAAPIILVMIKVLWILAYPMAKGLDYLLGVHGHHRIQHKDFANFLKGSKNLRDTEMLLLTSILQLRCERVSYKDIMVPLQSLYMLEESERLTSDKVAEINKKDYSYILVYKQRRQNLVGVIKTKEFALKYLASGNKTMRVKDIVDDNHQILNVYADTNLLEMLMLFQSKSYRYAVVIGTKKKIEPGVQSIMYSKSDMIAKKVDGKVEGVIFLYKIFEEIAEYNNQAQIGNKLPKHHEEVEMNELKKPLLKDQ